MISQPPKISIGGRRAAPKRVIRPAPRPKRGLPAALLAVFLPLLLIIPSSSLPSPITPRDLDRAGLWWPADILARRGVLSEGEAISGHSPDDGVMEASTLLGMAEPAQAEGAFHQWLASSPLSIQRPTASLGEGVAMLGRGGAASALETLQRGSRDFPVCAEADEFLFWEGEAASHGEDYPAAAASYESLLGRYPGSSLKPRALYGLGWSEGRLKKYGSAASRFEEAGRLDESLRPAATLQRGWCLLELGRIDEARGHFASVQAGWPGTRYSQEAVIGEAECAYRGGEFGKAEELYDSALKRAAGPAEKSVLRYSLAWASLKQKSFERARTIFLDTAREYPDEPVAPFATYRAALCLLDLGRPADALAELRDIGDKNPKHEVAEWSAYSRGWIFLTQGKFNDAKAAFRTLMDTYPDGRLVAPAAFLFAAAMFQERHFTDAEREFLSFADRYPSSGLADGALLWSAWAALMEGSPADALAHLDRMKREYPGSDQQAESAVAEGEGSFAIKNYTRAKTAYGRAASSKGDTRIRGLVGLGWCAFAAGDWKEAEKMFRTVLADAVQENTRLRARARLADALFNQKRYPEAQTQYRITLGGPDEEIARWSQLQLGWCSLRLEKPDEARGQWDQLRRRWPGSPEAPLALLAIAETLFGQEKYADSEQAFRKLSREAQDGSPLAENAALRVGDALYNAKSYEAAILAWRDFSTRFPASKRLVEALYGIQWAYVQLGDYQQARQEATSFLKLFPSSGLAAEVQLMVAESFRREKKTRDAVEQYRELIEKYPDSGTVPSARLKMGETQEEGGDFVGAQKTYADLIARHPDHPLAKEAAFRLGVARFAAGDTAGAAEVFTKVASDYSDPRASEAMYNLLLCKKKSGDPEGMREMQKKLMADFPRTRAAAQASLSLAYYYVDSGHREEAVPFFDAVASCPFTDLSSEAASALGDYWSGRDDKELALKSYLKGAEGLPKGGEWTVSSALSAAGMLRASSRDDEAIDLLRKILEKDDALPEWLASARLGIAQSYDASGRTKQARQMYVEVVKRGAPAELKKQAESRIAELDGGQAGSSTGLRESGGGRKKGKPAGPAKPKARKAAVKKPAVKGKVQR